jgi:hypothetical protein
MGIRAGALSDAVARRVTREVTGPRWGRFPCLLPANGSTPKRDTSIIAPPIYRESRFQA